MIARVVELSFDGPAHFGIPTVGVEGTETWLHSDSVFAALVCAWAELFGEAETLLDRFADGPPPFRLSSAFPYRRDWADDGQSRVTRFYPKPYLPPPVRPDTERRKDLKRLRWLPEPLFLQWLNGAALDDSQLDPGLGNGLAREVIMPNVSLDRATQRSNLFHVGRVQFAREYAPAPGTQLRLAWEAGLFVLVEGASDAMWEQIQLAFEWLGDCGIGGERSTGCGRFSPRWDSATLPEPQQPDGYGLLSLCAPTLEDAALCRDPRSRYSLLERSGWVASRHATGVGRRKSAWFLTEGSFFPNRPHGRLLDVTPPGFTAHPVVANGTALALGARME